MSPGRGRSAGAKFVVIDPYRTPAAQVADLHLAPLPGTDGALACAVMHVAFARRVRRPRLHGAATPTSRRSSRRTCASAAPDWASAITGLPAAEIEAFARLYCQTERAFIRLGYGFARSRNGAVNMHAVTCLPVGHRQVAAPRAAARSGTIADGIYHWDKTLIEGLDRVDPATRRMDMSRIGAVLTGDRARTRRRAAGPRHADPEHQPGGRGARHAPGPAGACCATTCSSASTSSS